MATNRIESEKKTVSGMIALYCKGQKHGKVLCEECRALTEYAHKRLELCKFGEGKGFCSNCTVHCYEPRMREAIKKAMRYSGPRMLFRHPVLAIRHVLQK